MTLLGIATGFVVWTLVGFAFWVTATSLGPRFAVRPRAAKVLVRAV